VNFFAASMALCEDFVPVTHIFPEANMSAVDRGSRRRMITAANRRGLNSVLRHRSAISFKFSFIPKFAKIQVIRLDV